MEKLVVATASPVVDSVVKKLGALKSVYADFEKLQSKLSTIQNVLHGAERRSITDEALGGWLRKLRDAALDAQDVVEEFETEALRRSMEGCDRMAGKVRDFFSSNNSIVFRYKMASKIKEIRERLDDIAEERLKFHLAEGSASERVVDRETSSFVNISEVYGRDDDREEVINFLLRTNNEEDVSVLPIVGLGGLGKTTLAKYAYNDERLNGRFDHKVWVCVSETFNINDIMRAIIEDVTGRKCEVSKLQSMGHQLETELSGKVFLLVLDDVWNESYEKWEKLKTLLMVGKKCKIVTTTRSDRVAEIMKTVAPKKLQGLDEDDCWTLFKQRAFENEREEENLTLVEIGKEIVKKCKGVPLAVQALGSLMRSKREEVEWLAIKNNEIWKLPMEEFKILPILKLSYDHLPSPMKPCFTYCSMFPKDHIFEINKLIQLWMAEGLIDTSDTHAEDIGKQYFNNLWQRSFFQDVKMDAYNNFNRCKMHDLIHDLACLLAKDESWFLEKGKENIPSGCRYLSIEVLDLSSNSLKTICEAKKLRSLVLLHCGYLDMPEFMFNVTKNLTQLHALDLNGYRIKKLSDGISNLKHLRLLNLSFSSITTLPTSITRLYNLQTLNLSYCAELQELPEDISTLYNLQTLNLSYCYKLQELPQDISSLINLRHLDISGYEKMSSIPHRLGQLTNLQTLGMFIVAQEDGRTIMELQHLNSIQGSLKIRGLQHVKDPNEAMQANLKIKKRLDCLELQWKKGLDQTQEPSSTNVVEEVLERLRPHDNLKELRINNYMGRRLPTWMSSSLLKLVELYLWRLERCGCLLPLGQLPLLKKLSMVRMRAIRRIGEEFYGDGTGGSAFPSLEVLYLSRMPNLEEWNTEPTILGRKMTTFLHLTKLSIISCPKLIVKPCIPCSVEELAIKDDYKMPLSEGSIAGLFKLKKLNLWGVSLSSSEWLDGLQCSISLEELHIRSCDFKNLSLNWEGRKQQQPTPFFTALRSLSIGGADELPEWIGGITSLCELNIWRCPKLATLPDGLRQLTALQSLDIGGAVELTALPEWIGGITSLQLLHIRHCPKLAMLPDGLRQLTALQSLSIIGCPQLAKRCKRETGEDWHKIAHIRVRGIKIEDGSEEEDRREAEDGEESSKVCTLVANFFGLFGLACCIGHN